MFNKKPKIEVCDMCGKADVEGCGSVDKHVVEIRTDEPSWLPTSYRAQAHGEFTWLCTRCGSYPAMKWPSDFGATAGLKCHLGATHHRSKFNLLTVGGGQPFDMIAGQ